MPATPLWRRGFDDVITATNVFEVAAELILCAGGDTTFNDIDDAGFGFAKSSRGATNLSGRANR